MVFSILPCEHILAWCYDCDQITQKLSLQNKDKDGSDFNLNLPRIFQNKTTITRTCTKSNVK